MKTILVVIHIFVFLSIFPDKLGVSLLKYYHFSDDFQTFDRQSETYYCLASLSDNHSILPADKIDTKPCALFLRGRVLFKLCYKANGWVLNTPIWWIMLSIIA